MTHENLQNTLRRDKIMSLPETTNAPFGASFWMWILSVVTVCIPHTFVVTLTSLMVSQRGSCVNFCATFGYTVSDQSHLIEVMELV